jgi:hypothetical protein
LPAELRGRVSVDASDLDRVNSRVRDFEQQVSGAFKRTGDIRFHRGVEEFAQNLAAGNITGSIEAITSRLTNLGLVGTVGLGLIGAGIAKAHEALEGFDKTLVDTGATLARMPEAGAGLETITKHIEALFQASEKLREKTTGVRGFAGLALSAIQDLPFGHETERRSREAESERLGIVTQLKASLQDQASTEERLSQMKLSGSAVDKLRIAAEQKIAELHADQLEKIQKILGLQLEAGQKRDLIAEVNKSTAERQETIKKETDTLTQRAQFQPFIEKAQLSADELREGKGSLAGRLQLQQADRLTALGERFRKQGFTGLAAEQFGRAEEIKRGIGELKGSEKMDASGFTQALNASAVLQQMAQRLVSIDINTANSKNSQPDFSNR